MANRAGLRVAVIVNDMSEVNIDAQLIVGGEAALSRTEEKLVEMTNGCICCTLREDLLAEVAALAKEGRFDYLLIESTGISEPAPVADTFTFAIQEGQALSDLAELDTMVTVVDAANFLNDLRVGKDLQSAGQAADADDVRTVSDLLIDQTEFANVVVLNKTDAASDGDLAEIDAFIDQLNPHALKLRAEFGRIDVTNILGTGRFDFEIARQVTRLATDLARRRCQRDGRVWSFQLCLSSPASVSPTNDSIKRLSKDWSWCAAEQRDSSGWPRGSTKWALWSQAGRVARLDVGGFWWAAGAARGVAGRARVSRIARTTMASRSWRLPPGIGVHRHRDGRMTALCGLAGSLSPDQ